MWLSLTKIRKNFPSFRFTCSTIFPCGCLIEGLMSWTFSSSNLSWHFFAVNCVPWSQITQAHKKGGLSQNTDYHIPMYFDVLNTNPLSVWYHQPPILRHSYHKRGKLPKRIYEEHQWIEGGIRTQLIHILMYFDSLNKNTLSIRSFYPLILCKSL